MKIMILCENGPDLVYTGPHCQGTVCHEGFAYRPPPPFTAHPQSPHHSPTLPPAQPSAAPHNHPRTFLKATSQETGRACKCQRAGTHPFGKCQTTQAKRQNVQKHDITVQRGRITKSRSNRPLRECPLTLFRKIPQRHGAHLILFVCRCCRGSSHRSASQAVSTRR
jgi:hypothetical protein